VEVIQVPFLSAVTQTRLSITPAYANRSVALHGLRSGCAISLAIAGTKLDAIMDHVGWTSPSTGGTAEALSFIKIDLADVYKEHNNLHGFTKAF